MLHLHGRIELCAVICNGGGQPRERAQLARCVLDHLGALNVPVGIGSEGTSYSAQPHEYNLEDFSTVKQSRLLDGRALMLKVLQRARPKSLRVVLISSLRDFADAVASHPSLVLDRVHTVAVQRGLERDPSRPSGWRADTSVNNLFDLAAADAVYAFCFAHSIRLTVVSRHAVPLLPMQLAHSFAERTNCPFLGLVGLWKKLCAGQLPARCSKQWFFETFCGEDAATFASRSRDALDERTDINTYLTGHVKPYDVLALMTVLPQTEALFSRSAASAPETALLLLTAQDAVPVEHDGGRAGADASSTTWASTYLHPNGTTVAASKSRPAAAAGAFCVFCFSLGPTIASAVHTRVFITLAAVCIMAAASTVRTELYAYVSTSFALIALEKTYFATCVAVYVVFSLALLGRMVVAWRRPRALVAAVFTATGTVFIRQSILAAALIGLFLGRVVLREHPPLLLAGIAVYSFLKLAIGCAILSKNALLNGRALIVSNRRVIPCLRGREEVGGGRWASLAPLLGFGTLRERDPQKLVQEAGRAFVPVIASEQSLRALGPTALFGSSDADDEVATRRSRSTPHSSQAERTTLRDSQAGRATPCAPQYANLSAEPDAATSPLPLASAKYYVVHDRYDDPQAKLDALAGWVSEFERAHGGLPSLFIGGVRAGISPVELLEHMPVYIARSERLLILAGPELPAQHWCAMECYTWFALGGRIEDVEVAIVASDAATAGAFVSAFDAFHVMYSLLDGDTSARQRFMAAIELVGVARFNWTLRRLVPRVKEAADRLSAQLGALCGQPIAGRMGTSMYALMGVSPMEADARIKKQLIDTIGTIAARGHAQLLARLSALAPIAAQLGNTTNSNQQIISLNALARAHYRRSIGTRGGAQASAAD
ncbi:hypothetical protein T492DRAFT_860811 [Pavlovales sp. CCMP2436]|nr:hypothetical protein T492DRAFT_860811 [Pavlovales sp. CCMP2436]